MQIAGPESSFFVVYLLLGDTLEANQNLCFHQKSILQMLNTENDRSKVQWAKIWRLATNVTFDNILYLG